MAVESVPDQQKPTETPERWLEWFLYRLHQEPWALGDYGDDSEPDSEPEPEETGGRGGGLVYGYGDDDLNRTDDVDEKGSGDEDSRESNSEMEDSDEGRDADDVETRKSLVLVARLGPLVSGLWTRDRAPAATEVRVSGNAVLCHSTSASADGGLRLDNLWCTKMVRAARPNRQVCVGRRISAAAEPPWQAAGMTKCFPRPVDQVGQPSLGLSSAIRR
ncbi:hypothetical protein INR49_000911 [Caranx melampygus]|nr:hypothetical protein INR49_000911 [Caranx melampygus]